MYPGASMPAAMTVAFLYLAEERLTHVDTFFPPRPTSFKGRVSQEFRTEE